MPESQKLPGASLDELLKKMQDVELALESLNTDLKSSQAFLVNVAALGEIHFAPRLELATPDVVKCLNLIQRYQEVYRRYLHSPLLDALPDPKAASGGKKANPGRPWLSGFKRSDFKRSDR